MKLRVRHTTEYKYVQRVSLCHNIVHLRPRDTGRQTCESYTLDVTPVPFALHEGVDFFGNCFSSFSLQEQHQGLSITSTSLVELTPGGATVPASGPWEQAAAAMRTNADDTVRPFVFDSPYVPTDPRLADYARPSFAPGRPVAEAYADLMRRIFREFKFKSGVTTVGTPVLDVLKNRQGVCQDFTHLMIGCVRSLGLPARYVSGYLLTRPPPGKPRLIGADASHAWVSVYVPDHGWMDLDPTNDCLPDDKHVTVGWARDYGDIGPVQGIIVGGRQQSLDVSVDVMPEDEFAAAVPA